MRYGLEVLEKINRMRVKMNEVESNYQKGFIDLTEKLNQLAELYFKTFKKQNINN